MKTTRTLIIFGLLLCHLDGLQGAGQTVQDCCLLTNGKRIPFGAIVGYEKQYTDKGCPIEAVVFVMNTNPPKRLCAPPGIPWVNKWIKKLDKRKKDMEKNAKKTKKSPKIQLE
ncbi:C-C motif chemokine 21c-like [Leptodactylus fuscus]